MLLIQNARVVDPVSQTDEMLDLVIDQGKIAKILRPEETPQFIKTHEVKTEDAIGCVVSPGLWDVHVHFRDPGFTYKEDIESGARAALAGGITTVVLMANTNPVVDNPETLQYVINKGARTDLHVKTCASISVGLKGKQLVDMETLKENGAVGFTDDGIPLLDESFVIEAMKKAADLHMPLSFHEENPAYIKNNGVNRGKASACYGIDGSDRMAEISMIERDIRLAAETGAEIDIQHISTAEGVELVRQARKKYPNIHAEATPHHFSLTEDAAIEHGTMAKMNPPLRTEEDREAIIRGLADQTIEIIATDHAPHAAEEKAKDITAAPSGILGLETALPLAVTNLVRPGHMTLMQVLERMTAGPCRLYHMEPPKIAEGENADLVVFNPDETFVYEKSLSKSQNSPFLGQTLYGKIHMTITDGKIVYRAAEI